MKTKLFIVVNRMSTIGIILVMYNQKHNLELLYTSLSYQTEKDFRIYFIDNNSNHDEINYSERINNKYKLTIDYIKLPYNTGYAGGNNVGAKKAIEEGCKYVFFLNNDTELEKECIKKLKELHETEAEIGAVSPIIFYWTTDKRNNIIQEYGSKAHFNRYKIIRNFEGTSFDEIENSLPEVLEADLLSGAAVFMKSDVLKRVGLWEESYFAYGDEIDLARRINEAGFRQVVTKNAVIWHNHKWNKDNKAGWYIEYFLIERNKFLYFHKYRLYIYLFLMALEDTVKFPWRLIWFVKKCDFKLGMYYISGMIHGLLNIKGKPKLSIVK